MPVSTKDLLVISGEDIAVSDSYITNTSTSLNPVGNGPCYASLSWNYEFDIQVSENLCLEKRSNNFLIINGGKTFITWSNEEGVWVEYKINSLEKKFKNNLKRKECKPFRDDSSGLNVVDMLICQEGNYYVDLKNSLYYVYSDGFWNSLDLIGDLFIDIEKPTNLKCVKSKKNEKTLLTEKIVPISLSLGCNNSLEPGYIYAPYVRVADDDLFVGGGGFSPDNTISSRYSMRNVNTNYFSSINTTGI